MKTLNKTVKCNYCGCLSLADSRSCPKCGSSFVVKENDIVLLGDSNNQLNEVVQVPSFPNSVNIRLSIVNKYQVELNILSIYS
jgi:RNA polymerase subunit RPABC4/transcription elongation factor Spt4